MKHLLDLTLDEFSDICVNADRPGYLAKQVFNWIYQKNVVEFHSMTNVSKADRQWLESRYCVLRSRVDRFQQATDGTVKLLLGWDPPAEDSLPQIHDQSDLRQTETVMIPAAKRRTACVSSQVGCPVGCRFCASGIGGLEGNLSAGQIVEQVLRLKMDEEVDRITNVVFMGMGEPLSNENAVTRAIRMLNASWGMGIGARHITVSTVGLPKAIRRFAKFDLPVTLALSLHAPNDELRRSLIPWADYSTVDELLSACQKWFEVSGREITLEYLLLRGVNDRVEHARQLARIASNLRSSVNLIRYNEVKGLPYERPSTVDVREFQRILRRHGVRATIRASRGRDIAAACGQLRYEQRSKGA
ncbi:MAG: 23S rRNA (adenine(2503)-C(2))-methyltransferase RlmN [Phycisphaerales bacterium]|nr:23S rRNA (adenine(2503)-C(2))-methyltransferase RlmN [Phycisphaerales bacterium]|tara:strand:+ start:7647 stop:8723 length:1077 start_codon:yes stop_codon:yes gene_type:complete